MSKIISKLKGVTFNNRQNNIKDLIVGQKLYPIREEDNVYDPNSILVFADSVHKLEVGHVSKEIAAELVGKTIDTIRVISVTGGVAGKSFGVNVEILVN